MYVIGEETNRLLSFSPNIFNSFTAYDHFVPLNDYRPIAQDTIADNAVDLVTCYPGLHHIPEDQLDAFVASIARVLRPGGILIFCKHDVTETSQYVMAHAAHELFNVFVGNYTEDDSNAEYRNFQKLSYWYRLLEKHGLQPQNIAYTQHGDPTANTLCACIKQPATAAETAHVLHAYNTPKDHQCSGVDTYLSALEWYNVDTSQAYGTYINHTPFYDFPYLKNVGIAWYIFYKSLQAAKKRYGTQAIITSPYVITNLFVGTFMTVEYGVKSLVSAPISWLYRDLQVAPLYITLAGDVPQHVHEACDLQCVSYDEDTGVALYKTSQRFSECTLCLQYIAQHTHVALYKINGHDTVQCKVNVSHELSESDLHEYDASILYSWTLPTQESHQYYAIAVPVDQLLAFIRWAQENGVTIAHIHDF